MTDGVLTQEEQRTQEVELAHGRMETDLLEVRRLVSVGAPATAILPYLDRIDADRNTARPVHVGWANYQMPDPTGGVVGTPTGVSGDPREPAANVPAETDLDGETDEEVGEDGLTDNERAARENQTAVG